MRRIRCSQIWSYAQDYVVLVLLLNVMEWGPGSTAWYGSGVGVRRPPRWRTCRYGRSTPASQRPAKHVAEIRQGAARGNPMYLCTSVTSKPAKFCLCHGTLRLHLGGVTVPYQDPTSNLYPYICSHSHLKGVFPKYLKNEDYGRKE